MGDKSEDVFQIALADVKTELMCPVCKGYLEDTYTTACMHRFCKECIHRVLRLDTMSLHKCPSCNAPMGHRRLLRKDAAFDRVVRLFREEDEDDDDDLDLAQVEVMRARQRDLRRSRDKRAGTDTRKRPRAGDSNGLPPPSLSRPVLDEAVNLKLHAISGSETIDGFVPLKQPYLTIPQQATCSVLKKYIRQVHGLADSVDVSLSLERGDGSELSDSATLLEVCGMWKPVCELVLSYAIIS